MNDLSKMRLGLLRELKNVHKFFDNMERSIKTRNPEVIQLAYIFMSHLVYHMDKGCLTPESIALDLEISRSLEDVVVD